MPRATPIDEDGLTKLARKARIEREQLDAFRSDMSNACKAHRKKIDPDAKDRPRSHAAELDKLVKSLDELQQRVSLLIAQLSKTLHDAPRAVLGMALPPAGRARGRALPQATLLWLPESLRANVAYATKRRDAVRARIERHRPAGAADMRGHLAIVLWQVAEKYSPRLTDAKKQDWLHEALMWCGAKPPARKSRRFTGLVKKAAAKARPAR